MALKCSWLFCCLFLLLDGPPLALSVTPNFSGGKVDEVIARRPAAAQRLHRKPLDPSSTPTKISLDTFAPIGEVDPQFLSVTIDAGDVSRNWSGINFTAPRIVNMARALNPAMLRVGGTSGDYLLFNQTTADLSSNGTEKVGTSNFTMTVEQWDAVNEFVESVGWEFIFGLNSLLRSPYPIGVWDSTNAAELMAYSNSKNYTVNWELGNEPDLWKNNITAMDHAKDYFVLKELIEREKQVGRLIVGPDVAYQISYFTTFLQSVGERMLNATTYHQYYGNGQTGKESEFYDVGLLDSFIHTATLFQTASDILQPNADLWLGETSSLYDSGAPHLSDSYVAGFMWLDKLGIAAVVGHKRVFRQDFVGGNYALLDADQNPLPDYWLSVLHKKLVGTKVLHVLGSLEDGRYLRAYAHCAKPPYPAGSVVLLLLNMNFSAVSADLVNSELVSSRRDVFWLSPPSGNLTSTAVQLNGVTLQLVENTELPDLKPEQQPASPSLSLPSISFGFIVFKEAKIYACQ